MKVIFTELDAAKRAELMRKKPKQEVERCSFFGVRGDALEKNKQCKRCKQVNGAFYKKCTKVTDKLLITSIIVEKGKTKHTREPVSQYTGKKLGVTTDRNASKVQNIANDPKTTVTGRKETEPKMQRLPRVTGVIDKCVQLLAENMSQKDIEAVLIEMYIAATYPEEKAKARARSIYSGQLREQKKK
jgi:hypothetical protein